MLSTRDRMAVSAARLGPLLRSAGDQLGVPSRHALNVRLSDDQVLRSLNAKFLGRDEPTDVLAFPGDGVRVGDIAISLQRAAAQRDDVAAELRVLAIHGLLHCLGHDHADAAGARRMTEQTRRLLPGEAVPELALLADAGS